MTAAERQLIADADERYRRAEAGELDARIQLAILRQQIHAHETAEAKRKRKLIEASVEKLVATGAVHPGNLYGQFNMLEQLARDPSLVTLVLTKRISRAGPAGPQ